MIEALRRNMMAKSGLIEDDSKKYILVKPNAYFFIDIPTQYKTIGVKVVVEVVEFGLRYFCDADNSMSIGVSSRGSFGVIIVNNPYYYTTNVTVKKQIKYVICNNFLDSNEATIDGNIITENVGNFTLSRRTSFYLCAGRGYYAGLQHTQGSYKIYQIEISSGNNIIFSFSPHIENGTAGFYDKTNNVFHPSITGVPFEYGEDV